MRNRLPGLLSFNPRKTRAVVRASKDTEPPPRGGKFRTALHAGCDTGGLRCGIGPSGQLYALEYRGVVRGGERGGASYVRRGGRRRSGLLGLARYTPTRKLTLQHLDRGDKARKARPFFG